MTVFSEYLCNFMYRPFIKFSPNSRIVKAIVPRARALVAFYRVAAAAVAVAVVPPTSKFIARDFSRPPI